MGSAAGAREESEGGRGKRFAPVFFEKFCLRQTVFSGKSFRETSLALASAAGSVRQCACKAGGEGALAVEEASCELIKAEADDGFSARNWGGQSAGITEEGVQLADMRSKWHVASMSEVNCGRHGTLFYNFYENPRRREVVSMDEQDLRKHVLGAKKTERIIFAATPEMKSALERIAHERCTSVSALLTSLALDEVIANKELFDGSAE